MSPVDCAALRNAIEPLAAGEPPTPAQQAHLAGCASCQARLALAVRLERVLAEWPVPVPGPALAQRVLATTRQEAWQREQVVDWGFNVAIAAGLTAIVAGASGDRLAARLGCRTGGDGAGRDQRDVRPARRGCRARRRCSRRRPCC